MATAVAEAGGRHEGGAAPPPEPPAEPPSSRLCVKNIPKYLKEARLKEHFAAKGQVTDVKILQTRDGTSRQMAFVGFRSTSDAQAALAYFQGTFIDTSRISIEFARRYRTPAAAAAGAAPGEAEAAAHTAGEPRPWSKYSAGSSKHQALLAKQAAAAEAAAAAAAARSQPRAGKAGKKGKQPVAAAPEAQDEKLAEFLQLMQPRSRAKIWSNDDLLPGSASAPAPAAAGAKRSGAKPRTAAAPAGAKDEAGEPDPDLPAAAAAAKGSRGRSTKLPRAAAQAAAAAANGGGGPSGGSSSSESDDGASDDEGGALAGKDAAVLDAGVSDLDYLRSRMRRDGLGSDDTAAAGASSGSSSSSGSSDAQGEGASSEGPSDMEGVEPGRSSSSEQGAESSQEQAGGSGGESGEGTGSEQGPGSERGGAEARAEAAGGARFDAAARGDQAGVGPSGAAAGGGEAGAARAAILDTGRLFVRNLSYGAGEAELSELFGGHGSLEEVHLVVDRETKRSKGLAHVQFVLPEDALAAWQALDMTPFQGRLMHVLPGRKKPGDETGLAPGGAGEAGPGGEGGEAKGRPGASSFKAQREAQRRGDAGNRAAWSTLYIRPDTVAAAVAAHFGVSKGTLLDASAPDLPLRLALGEAQVIAQTKGALAEAGVNMGALEAAAAASGSAAAKKSVPRSASSLLVKNLPYSADEDELRELFAANGRSLVRLVLPPSKALALVEFAEPQDARSAFKSLAYRKYQTVPLYLEWAPRDIWDSPAPAAPPGARRGAAEGDADAEAAAAASGAAAAAAGGEADADADADADGRQGGAVASIYVKNLSFATSDEGMRRHFDAALSAAGGCIHSAKVARRKGPDGKLLSMGFGFVEVDSEAAAKAAIKALQGSRLDKHKLQLQLSKRGAGGGGASAAAKAAKAAAKAGGTKLVVRNVAFEATRKDVLGLFGPFGHIKSCRLPKKFDGGHRGFAFLEFTTKQEAASALAGAGGTHLYGRRLVVEPAQADDDSGGLNELRAKTAARSAAAREEEEGAAALGPSKRLRKDL